jgi:pilus assembly protein CpaF
LTRWRALLRQCKLIRDQDFLRCKRQRLGVAVVIYTPIHDGSLTTVHANSPRDALSRLETMVLMAGTELPSRAIREQITSAVKLLVHVNRSEDGVRRVTSISEITGLEGDTPLLQELFRWQRSGRNERRIVGTYVATGIVPRLAEQLRERGADLPPSIFQPDGEASSPTSSRNGDRGA